METGIARSLKPSTLGIIEIEIVNLMILANKYTINCVFGFSCININEMSIIK